MSRKIKLYNWEIVSKYVRKEPSNLGAPSMYVQRYPKQSYLYLNPAMIRELEKNISFKKTKVVVYKNKTNKSIGVMFVKNSPNAFTCSRINKEGGYRIACSKFLRKLNLKHSTQFKTRFDKSLNMLVGAYK